MRIRKCDLSSSRPARVPQPVDAFHKYRLKFVPKIQRQYQRAVFIFHTIPQFYTVYNHYTNHNFAQAGFETDYNHCRIAKRCSNKLTKVP